MSTFEILPDEILLELCRYLHPYDILYSFTNLNQRLTQTITDFSQQISLTSILSYDRYLNLFQTILPTIWSNIHQLTIDNSEVSCLSTLFLRVFQQQYLPSQLKKLSLLNVNTYEIYRFITEFLPHTSIEELIIDCTDEDAVKQQELYGYKIAQTLFFHHPTLKSIEIHGSMIFDLNHLSFLSLSNADESNANCIQTQQFLLQRLTVPLRSLSSLHLLLIYQPYLQYLNVIIGHAETMYDYAVTPFPPLINLTEFELHSEDFDIKFEHLVDLLVFFPNLKSLALNLSTECREFFNGHHLQKLAHSLERFQFSISRFVAPTTDEQSLMTFTTPFWLETKHWYTQAYWNCEDTENDGDYFHIYTLPYAFSDFDVFKCSQENCFFKDQFPVYPQVKRLELSESSDVNIIPFLKRCSKMQTICLNDIYDDEENYGTDEEEDITDLNEGDDLGNLSNHSILTPLTNLYHVRDLILYSLPEHDLTFLERLVSATPNLVRLGVYFDDLLEILSHSSPNLTEILRRQIGQLKIHLDYQWTMSDIRRDLSKIFRLFANLKAITITPYSSQKTFSRVIREIVSYIQKSSTKLICVNFEEIPSEDMELLKKQKSIEFLLNTLGHVELNSTSLTIWL